jgi:hypothetical protein
MGTLLIVVVLASYVWSLWILAHIPQLLLRPAAIERLSTLRDNVYDARRAGAFNYGDECVHTLLSRIEAVVQEGEDGTAWAFDSATQYEAVAVSAVMEGLGDVDKLIYLGFEDRLRTGANRLLFRGKWNGAIEVYIARWARRDLVLH